MTPASPAPPAAPGGPAPPPRILAPAGNRAAFLAAVAAGADAVYCGLKRYSARMEAKNFGVEELAALAEAARRHGTAVYVAVNSLLKPADLLPTGRLLAQLVRQVAPEALILQDPAVIDLARQAGFQGELHLSTLGNAGFPAALAWLRHPLGVDQVVLPRELDADELRMLAAACPPDLGLELFVHGALCYGVSGRCYWSSFLGGKSGLRGRCVQPCRRLYRQGGAPPRRLFACLDLSLDVLTKAVRGIPAIRAWKIEGRKKGPHYVFYTVTAYRLLRDEGRDPQARRDAQDLLAQALGRPGSHYRFIAHRPSNPVQPDQPSGSGLFLGALKGAGRELHLRPRVALLPGDLLRVGTEDEAGYALVRIRRGVPARGRFTLPAGRERPPAQGTPVFLSDRLEPALSHRLRDLEAELTPAPAPVEAAFRLPADPPARPAKAGRGVVLTVQRPPGPRRGSGPVGLWVDAAPGRMGRREAADTWWWLPPVSWPRGAADLADRLGRMQAAGARRFVVNAPWQAALLAPSRGTEIWAGPFCNIANPMAVAVLARCGFTGVIASPELGREDYLALAAASPLPLGIVVAGLWPLCVSRVLAAETRPGQPFESPRGEQAWVAHYGEDYWVFPNWRLDLGSAVDDLRRAGYRLFVHLEEPVPPGVRLKPRPGLWNWEVGLA